jgi:hypothetical protein
MHVSLVEENLRVSAVTLDYLQLCEHFMNIIVQMSTFRRLVYVLRAKSSTLEEKKSNIGDLSNIIGLSCSPIF